MVKRMPPSDSSLLQSFVRYRDEKAFRTLVDRHLGLIFQTALRRTGDRTLAENVSQTVLCILAKKASLVASHPERLPAWLHRTTLYESMKAIRAESSRQRREQLQHPDNIPETARHNDAAWSAALPYLDVALDKLPEPDRRVLLLHYFESQPFPKIADLLGKSPAAVQKQAVRALEKLSRVLRSKGVVIPVAVLATGLTSGIAKAAPAALGSSATVAALSGSAGLFNGSILMISTHTKLVVPCLLVTLALPVAFQQVAISKAEKENASLRSLTSIPQPTSLLSTTNAGGLKISSSLDILQLADEARDAQRSGPLGLALKRKLAPVELSRLSELLQEAASASLSHEKRGYLAESLVRALAARDLKLAMEGIAAFPDNLALLKLHWVKELFKEWAFKDPQAALTWIDELQRSPTFADSLEPTVAPSQVEQHANPQLGISQPLLDMQAALVGILMQSDPSSARRYLEGFPAETSRITVVHQAISSSYGKYRGLEYLDLIRDLIPEKSREPMLAELVTGSLRIDNDLTRIEPLFEEGQLSDRERHAIASTAATTFYTRNYRTIPRDPNFEKQLDDWLEKVAPDDAAGIGADAREEAAKEEASQAANVIEALQLSRPDDDRLTELLTSIPMQSHLKEALELAGKIKDPAKQAAALKFLNDSAKP
jgi:RNA polymerase sigma factor (sigma-70 family)